SRLAGQCCGDRGRAARSRIYETPARADEEWTAVAADDVRDLPQPMVPAVQRKHIRGRPASRSEVGIANGPDHDGRGRAGEGETGGGTGRVSRGRGVRVATGPWAAACPRPGDESGDAGHHDPDGNGRGDIAAALAPARFPDQGCWVCPGAHDHTS